MKQLITQIGLSRWDTPAPYRQCARCKDMLYMGEEPIALRFSDGKGIDRWFCAWACMHAWIVEARRDLV